MNVEVLPGPSLAERARTAIAQARLATVTWGDPEVAPGFPDRVTATAAIRVDRLGRPLLLLPPRETVTRALATSPRVTVTVAAPAPLRWLALSGAVQARPEVDGRVGHLLDVRACAAVRGTRRDPGPAGGVRGGGAGPAVAGGRRRRPPPRARAHG
ncbi:MAG TPA: hypothetical protein VGI00_24665 [Streptosporangiaceae bacterium]